MYSEEYENDQSTEINSTRSGGFYQNNKILVWIFIAIILIAAIIFIVKKSSNSSNNENNTGNKYAVTIHPETDVEISIGNSYKLVAVANNAADATFTWSSDNESVATVNDSGVVTGVGYGKATITAVYARSDTAKYENKKIVTIAEGKSDIPLTDISIEDGDLLLPINGTYTILLNMTPSNGYVFNKKFTSSNEGVVTVDNTGIVTGVNEGQAMITIDVNDGAFRKTLNVYVSSSYASAEILVNPTKITIDSDIKKIKVGTTAKLNYNVTPSNVDATKLLWSSSNESILTIDKNGLMTALKEGKSTIKISSLNGSVSDSLEIEVVPSTVEVSEIGMSLTDLVLEVGQSQEITPYIIPTDATDKTLTFTAADSSVISVSPSTGEKATIVAIKEGTTTLTIKSSNNITKTLNITVNSATEPPSGGGSGSSGGSSGSSSKNCSKVTCSAGQYCSSGKCYTCKAGYYCVNNTMTKCPTGYSSGAGSSHCTGSGGEVVGGSSGKSSSEGTYKSEYNKNSTENSLQNNYTKNNDGSTNTR